MPKPVHAQAIHPILSSLRRVRLREALKAAIGYGLGAMLPNRLEQLEQNPLDNYAAISDRLMRTYLLRRAIRSGDYDALGRYHRAHWRQHQVGEGFFDNTADRFERWLLGEHRELLDRLEEIIATASPAYATFYEIGCGAGQALEYFAARWPTFDRLVGIDLNDVQIDKNQLRIADPRIEWVSASALPWLQEHARAPAMYFSNAGVLEYFAPAELSALLAHIAAQPGRSHYALIEPLDPRIDLETDNWSKVFGGELTFSHNYPRLFEHHGFQVVYRAERRTEGDRVLLLIAMVGA